MAADTLKALAQANPATAVVAGLVDMVQSRKARKQMRWLVAVVEHHDGSIDQLRAAVADEHLLEMVTSALTAAGDAHTDEKVLMRPEASRDQTDTGQYLIGLDALDITVLRAVGSPRRGTGHLAREAIVGGMSRKDLAGAGARGSRDYALCANSKVGQSAGRRGRFPPGLKRHYEWKVTVMGQARAKELPARRSGDRGACPSCNPRPDRVPMDRLWAWSLEHPGMSPFRATAAGEVPAEGDPEDLPPPTVVAMCACGAADGAVPGGQRAV